MDRILIQYIYSWLSLQLRWRLRTFPLQDPRIVGRVRNTVSNTAERDRLPLLSIYLGPHSQFCCKQFRHTNPFRLTHNHTACSSFYSAIVRNSSLGRRRFIGLTSRSQFSTERCLDGIHGGNPCLLTFLYRGWIWGRITKTRGNKTQATFWRYLCPHDDAGNIKEELKMCHGLWRKRFPSRISLFKTELMLER